MRTLVCILLIAGLTYGLQLHSSNQKNTQKLVSDIKESKLGQGLLNLITLHSEVKGPVEELVGALQALVEDLTEDIEYLNNYEKQFKAEMNRAIDEAEQDIAEAETDIARTEDVLINLLFPRRTQLENKIKALENNAATNRKNLSEETLNREAANAAYLVVVAEYNDALAAVDEALALLASITNPTLIQAKALKKSLNKINFKAFSKVGKGPMVQALVELAISQNFSDQGIIFQIVAALNEFRDDIVTALNKAHAEEENAAEEFHQRVDQLNAEYAEFQRQINATNVDLTATLDKIEELKGFLAQRKVDLANAQSLLAELQQSLADGVAVLAEIRDRYTHELAVSEKALAYVQGIDFSNIRA